MVLIETQKQEFSHLKDINIFEKASKEDAFSHDLLIIGLGGLGGRVLRSLKGMLQDQLNPEDNISWFLIDSDIPEMEQHIQDSKDGNGLNALQILSIYRPNLDDILEKGWHGQPVQENLARWMSSDFPKIHIGTSGAEGNRQIGRLMFSNAYEDLRVLLFEKLDDAWQKSGGQKLDVLIVSSTAGGTGSGILSDLTYNIKAYARSRKWQNFRIGGCLLMPDVLFANRSLYENDEKRMLLQANSYAAMEEISRLMQAKYNRESYTFESGTHRLQMCDNIFDACMLVSGKKDEQGYIPDGIICSDVAYFLTKLAANRYINESDASSEAEEGSRILLRDAFFSPSTLGYFKVFNETDYKIPVREIENICEGEIFDEAGRRLHSIPVDDAPLRRDVEETFSELREFLSGAPGDDINLDVSGLIRPGQYAKAPYKLIKKHKDELSTRLPQQLEDVKKNMPVMVKAIRIKLFSSLSSHIDEYLKEYGPFVTLQLIGDSDVIQTPDDEGMVKEVRSLEKKMNEYAPSNEFDRTIESILHIVARRFFAFPSARRETERGYYEASIKSALAQERNMLMEEMNKQDVFGDIVRQLRQRSEQISEIYEPFWQDLSDAVHDLARNGERITGFLLKDAVRQEFLPTGYLTEARIEDMKKGLIHLMVDHENDIDTEKVVPVTSAMEHLYRNFLIGIGTYAPEKLLATAFSTEEPDLASLNAMFVAPDSPKRKEAMNRAAAAFVSGSAEKIQKKQLCILNPDKVSSAIYQKYISLPDSMPYFNEAVKALLSQPPYEDDPNHITENKGELVISVDSIFSGVRPEMLEGFASDRAAYDTAVSGGYMGIHII